MFGFKILQNVFFLILLLLNWQPIPLSTIANGLRISILIAQSPWWYCDLRLLFAPASGFQFSLSHEFRPKFDVKIHNVTWLLVALASASLIKSNNDVASGQFNSFPNYTPNITIPLKPSYKKLHHYFAINLSDFHFAIN